MLQHFARTFIKKYDLFTRDNKTVWVCDGPWVRSNGASFGPTVSDCPVARIFATSSRRRAFCPAHLGQPGSLASLSTFDFSRRRSSVSRTRRGDKTTLWTSQELHPAFLRTMYRTRIRQTRPSSTPMLSRATPPSWRQAPASHRTPSFRRRPCRYLRCSLLSDCRRSSDGSTPVCRTRATRRGS